MKFLFDTNMEKACFKCGERKSLGEFYAHPMMRDGHLNKCKECAKRDANRRYKSEEGRAKIVEYERIRFQDPVRRQSVHQYAKRYRLRFPDKYRARNSVNNAIRDGGLVKMPCEICGGVAQAHHEDYSRALDVRWLCFRHHRETHGQIVSL